VALLSGWKEIAEHLHLTVRTAQRWERLGLPIRRVSKSKRSPVVAISDEIEQWVRKKESKVRGSKGAAYFQWGKLRSAQRSAQRKARKLIKESSSLMAEQRRLLGVIRSNLKKQATPP
jgi:hypothetical protein